MKSVFSPEQLAWLENGERGLSSETIFTVLSKLPRAVLMKGWGFHTPSDPSDFRRCELLLEAVPEFRKRFAEMRQVEGWAPFVEHWQELCDLMDSEAGDWRKPHAQWCAKKTYNRMQELERETKTVGNSFLGEIKPEEGR